MDRPRSPLYHFPQILPPCGAGLTPVDGPIDPVTGSTVCADIPSLCVPWSTAREPSALAKFVQGGDSGNLAAPLRIFALLGQKSRRS